MTKKQFLLLFFLCGGLFRAVPQPQSYVPEPPAVEIPSPEQTSVEITEVFENSWDGSKTEKVVFILALVENVDPSSVDLAGSFPLHQVKVYDKLGKAVPIIGYKLGSDGFNLATEKVDLFKDRPFGPGEKKSIAMAFTVPRAMKLTKISIPTKEDPINLSLPPVNQEKSTP